MPAALVAPWAASLGDRYPRNRVLTLGYLVQAVAMLATAAAMLADAPVPVVILLATATASSLVVSRPTQSALLPSLARTPEELTAANGVAGAVEGVGLLIGPLLAAAILAVSTPAAVFAAGGATMVFASLVTIGLRPRGGLATLSGTVASEPTTLEATAGRDDGGILAGLRAIGGDPDALLVVGLLTARMVMIGASDVLFVLMALELLDTGESGAGIARRGAGCRVHPGRRRDLPAGRAAAPRPCRDDRRLPVGRRPPPGRRIGPCRDRAALDRARRDGAFGR